MSETASPYRTKPGDLLPLSIQLTAWVVGLAACVAGMLDLVAEWEPMLATVQFVVLAVAPAIFMLPRRLRSRPSHEAEPATTTPTATASATTPPAVAKVSDWLWCLLLGGISFGVSLGVGLRIGDLPPAYHDEFSYLFQAKTLLAGRFSFPSHPRHPELFDQMHVLNEGRTASRYYPGTGLWLAPFVAVGHPFLGQWIAGALSTMLIFWTGRELGGRQTGFFAALVMALSPGIALFGNTLLAHHPTLLSLSVFLLGVARWRRTRAAADAWMAGGGLSFAMLCRPMTAAAVGLPFGLDFVVWLFCDRQQSSVSRFPSKVTGVIGFGVPLVFGWGIMLWYNHSVTGGWLTSPYQQYTDIYTPRHVYGFNNVVRGERQLGPKVIDAYDRVWTENLTPALAARNALTRWIASWLWTFDALPLLVSTVVFLGALPRLHRRWSLIVSAIVSLHILHVPYWYVGIMGWHYVFESAPLWCLILGGTTSLLFSDWKRRSLFALPFWWRTFLAVSVAGVSLAPFQPGPSRLIRGLSSLKHPRQRHAELRQWVEDRVDHRPALVLIEQKDTIGAPLDLVVNEPGLASELLLGRFRPGETDVAQIHRDFPDRHLYVACPDRGTIRRID
jgi:hypothetical protein